MEKFFRKILAGVLAVAAAGIGVPAMAEESEKNGPDETVPASGEIAEFHYFGSDFFAGTLEEKFQEIVTRGNDKIALKSEMRGSRWAISKLRDGKCDFAIALVPDVSAIPEIKDGSWKAIPIAYQTAMVVVPRSNKIEQISFYQLQSIFARYATKRCERWREISPNFDAVTKIRALIDAMPGSSLSAFFQSKVCPSSSLRQDLVRVRGNDEVLRDFTYESIAIVAQLDAEKFPTLKAIAVSASVNPDDAGTAYAPTPTNIFHRDYPLSVPFYFVYPVENRERILPMLEAVIGDEFAAVLESRSLIVNPKSTRVGILNQIKKYREK